MWDPAQVAAGGDGLDQYDTSVPNREAVKELREACAAAERRLTRVRVGQPLSSSDPLYSIHPVGHSVPNFGRITVHGKTLPIEWLKLTIDPSTVGVFSWQEMPVS